MSMRCELRIWTALLPLFVVMPVIAYIPSQLLLDCYNSADGGDATVQTDIVSFLDGRPIRLELRQLWWSSRHPIYGQDAAGTSDRAGDGGAATEQEPSMHGAQLPLTVYTMASLDRLPQLEAQCLSYPGPLSAALYVPLLEQHPGSVDKAAGVRFAAATTVEHLGRSRTIRRARRLLTGSSGDHDSDGDSSGGGGIGGGGDRPGSSGGGGGGAGQQAQQTPPELRSAVQRLEAFFARMEAAGPRACGLVLALYSERLRDGALAALMPTNALRNAALLPVSTPLAAMVDVDLSASDGLARLAANASRTAELLAAAAREKAVWVMPAWETNRQLDMRLANCVADEALAGSKSTLSLLWHGAAHAHADGRGAPEGHAPEASDGSGAAGTLGSSCLASAAGRRTLAAAQAGAGAAPGAAGPLPARRRLRGSQLRARPGGHGPAERQAAQAAHDADALALGLRRQGPRRRRKLRGPQQPGGERLTAAGSRRLWGAEAAAEAGARGGGRAAALGAAGLLHPFDAHKFTLGHGPTDFERFLASDAPYTVPYVEGYEPWFIAARNTTLPYDERYRGWYGDKFSQVMHVAAHRFAFRVLPDAWLVHRPHAPTAAAAIFHRQGGGPTRGVDALSEVMVRRFLPRTKFQHYISHSRNLDYRQRRGLVRGTYRPSVGKAFERCRAVLPWWSREEQR